MKIPYEVKDKLENILSKRQASNTSYPNGVGLPRADFNETTSDIVEYLKEFLRDELIKYEAHQRIDRATHIKEFEFAEQAVDNYLNPPKTNIEKICDDCCDNIDINNEYIAHVFQWLIDNGYEISKK